ncbi:MAG: BON domain-containing protein [Solirubrobacteraceae bacterium]|jgi:osmotically-inducible protein OsmY
MVVAVEQKLTAQLSHAWQQWLSDLRGRSEAARSAKAAARQRRSAHAKPRKENDMKTASSDKTIRDAVIRELEWDPRVHTDHIGVSAGDGAVVLSGHVPSYSDRWEAIRAAERVYGVRAVADEIEIKLGQSSVRNDEDIAEDVARHMHVNTAIPAGVKADVIKGHVILRGDCQWGL